MDQFGKAVCAVVFATCLAFIALKSAALLQKTAVEEIPSLLPEQGSEDETRSSATGNSAGQ